MGRVPGDTDLAMPVSTRPSPLCKPPRAMIFRLAIASPVAAATRAWISARHVATRCSVARVLLPMALPRILGLVLVGGVEKRGVIAAVEYLGLAPAV